jgi:hypothetical protein
VLGTVIPSRISRNDDWLNAANIAVLTSAAMPAISGLIAGAIGSSSSGHQVSNSAACVFATRGSMLGGNSIGYSPVSDAHGANRRVCTRPERSDPDRLVKLSNWMFLDEHAKRRIDYQIDQVAAELIQTCQR